MDDFYKTVAIINELIKLIKSILEIPYVYISILLVIVGIAIKKISDHTSLNPSEIIFIMAIGCLCYPKLSKQIFQKLLKKDI